MLRLLRLFRWIALAAIGVAVVVALGTVVPRPFFAPAETERTREILLLSNPIHTDIAIPINLAVQERFAFLGEAGIPLSNPAAQWLIVGWGGRAFYLETPTWGDLKPMPVLKALTVDRSVMHVDVAGAIVLPHPAIEPLMVSDTGFERLLDVIDASFDRSTGDERLIVGAAYGMTDQFFEARGYFNALVGCNLWTAAALRAAGLQTGWWAPLPVNLRASLSLHNETQSLP